MTFLRRVFGRAYAQVLAQGKVGALFLGLLIVLWSAYVLSMWHPASQTSTTPVAALPGRVGQKVQTASHGAVSTAWMTVYVVGAVHRPGLYHLPLDARLADAIAKAGGATAAADLGAIDLAAVVEDGMEIVVPSQSQTVSAAQGAASATGGNFMPAEATGDAASSFPDLTSSRHRHHKRKLAFGERLNVNTATLALLEELPGIGPKKAAAILQYRARHGAYTALADLRAVPGIGPGLLAKITPYLTLS